MNPSMELRHGLMRAAKIRLRSMGRKPTQQAARALVDQHLSRLRKQLRDQPDEVTPPIEERIALLRQELEAQGELHG